MTADYTTCCMNSTANLRRYMASLEAVQPPWKNLTAGRTVCSVKGLRQCTKFTRKLSRSTGPAIQKCYKFITKVGSVIAV